MPREPTPPRTLPPTPPPTPPAWLMPADLATIIDEDGEWEDPSWDPLLLTVVGDTRHEGRLIPMAWQLSLWPDDAFFEKLNGGVRAAYGKADGHGWAALLRATIATRAPALSARLHDDSDASTCVLWVEREADGRALIETIWLYLHGPQAA